MRTLGIDLSANPAKTGVCLIDWDAGSVELLHRPMTDEELVPQIADCDLAGIDVPLGWPDEFVAAVAAHHTSSGWPPVGVSPPGDREPLRFRRTDVLARAHGARPLSVSSDLIGVAAMRGARLQHLLVAAGVPVDRSGTTGRIGEVYPAAALRHWRLTASGYKGRKNELVCSRLAESLAVRFGTLTETVRELLAGCDDDSLDAVVCAVLARAVLLDCTSGPPLEEQAAARREGWIHIPTADLETIIAGGAAA
jgi:predicted nuclease with RNAse H fold